MYRLNSQVRENYNLGARHYRCRESCAHFKN